MTGTYKIIDLSWYAPYKQFGDSVIAMFFYLGFIWHSFINIGSIISGGTSAYRSYDSYMDRAINSIEHTEGPGWK